MREQCAAHATATQKAASNEEPQQPALPASAFPFVLVVLALILVFVVTRAALTQEMEEDRPTNAAAAQYPAANQKSQDPAMIFAFAFAFVFIVIVVFVFVLVPLLAALAQEVGEKQAPDPAAAQQAACNEKLQDTMLLIAALLALVAKIVAFFLATALTKQAREKQASHPAAAQAAADHQFIKFQVTHDILSLCSG
jgi:NADH:ubiquinone oxidoreductase subunit 3 (subunit A)